MSVDLDNQIPTTTQLEDVIIMMFRCPYCGEKVFSSMLKMRIHSKFGTAPICPACKKVVYRELNSSGNRGYYAIGGAFSLLVIGLLALGFSLKSPVFIVLSIFLLLALYLFYNYFLCHFDVTPKSKKNYPVIQIDMDKKIHLWPHIRQGEIYILVPNEVLNPKIEDMQTLGLLDRIVLSKEKWNLFFRVIKASESATLKSGCLVKIISDTDFDIQGQAI